MLLSQLKENQVAQITAVNTDCKLSKRLLEMGFAQGQKIECVNVCFSGSPIAYKICGTKLALRKKDADLIGVIL